jgi:hypothetical protein
MISDDNQFDPEDLEEMDAIFRNIEDGEKSGYELVFFINENDADELVSWWYEAMEGDPFAASKVFTEFGKIMNHLMLAMSENGDET